MLTIEEIKNLTDEELATLNKKAYRNLAKQIALRIGVGVAVHVAVSAIVKKIETRHEETETVQ